MTADALVAKLKGLRTRALKPFYLTATFGMTDNRHLRRRRHRLNRRPRPELLSQLPRRPIRNSAWFASAVSIDPGYLRNDDSDASLVTDSTDW
ncbi:hypothetical protein jhhlp_003622 [Lomentospora prolificans]|uniref:Uncharacterized protein n=1 Tax=Lomentospora prolificans TaxID=41688 RepID=A0A2N3N994_9PEZI|nr:hypothetical protein jhhlp_003622 [Lomentospora prolificans]